jgi:hypothetical protein
MSSSHPQGAGSASPSDGDTTMLLFQNDTSEAVTMPLLSPAPEDPTVGWLVCVKGAYQGQSFPLRTGSNSIGRAMDMDVSLAKESMISNIRHCVITYEADTRDFFVHPGESNDITYLNGSMVTGPTLLKDRDRISLGLGEFLFVPFCTKDLYWKGRELCR